MQKWQAPQKAKQNKTKNKQTKKPNWKWLTVVSISKSVVSRFSQHYKYLQSPCRHSGASQPFSPHPYPKLLQLMDTLSPSFSFLYSLQFQPCCLLAPSWLFVLLNLSPLYCFSPFSSSLTFLSWPSPLSWPCLVYSFALECLWPYSPSDLQ